MNDDRLEKALQAMAQDYNAPPDTPREEMWTEIQTRRRHSPRRRPGRIVRVAGWGVGVAAALVIGVGIGRRTASDAGGENAAVATAADAGANETNGLYQFAATQHLAQVEVFLTMFRVDAASGRPIDEAGISATDLLSTTRLYLDSPASDNPQLRGLLEDIELVLAQIAQVTRPDTDEFTLIDESIEQKGVLLRLQSAVGADGRTGAQGAL